MRASFALFIAAGGLAPAFASAEEHCFEWCMSSPCDDLSGNSLPYECGACGEAAACRPGAAGYVLTDRGRPGDSAEHWDSSEGATNGAHDEPSRVAVDSVGAAIAVDGGGGTADNFDGGGMRSRSPMAPRGSAPPPPMAITSELLLLPPSLASESTSVCFQLGVDGAETYTHGCDDQHALTIVACDNVTDARPLLTLLTHAPSLWQRGHAASFGCLLRALSASGVTLAGHDADVTGVTAVSAFATHLNDPDFVTRLAAGDVLAFLTPRACSACVAAIACVISQYEISTRWVAVDTLERIGFSRLSAPPPLTLALLPPSVAATHGPQLPPRPVSSAEPTRSLARSADPTLLAAFLERLDPPHSPGTRWMAVKCLALFGDCPSSLPLASLYLVTAPPHFP